MKKFKITYEPNLTSENTVFIYAENALEALNQFAINHDIDSVIMVKLVINY